ncbi:hypothetical protein DFH09DRAFT_1459848 [Mycena vulgaris]|nr:hypothetical protein DFH09DRAFT_1459848 [Mycena vulgaris]
MCRTERPASHACEGEEDLYDVASRAEIRITADADSGYCLPAQVHPMPQCRRCLFLRRNLHVYRPRPADAHLPDNSGGRKRFLGSKLPPRTTATTAQRVRPLRAPAPAFRAAFQLQHITEIRTRPLYSYWHRHMNGEMLRTPSLGADGPFTHLAGSTSDLGLASTISGTLSQRRHRDCACDDAPEMHHSPSQSDSSYSSVESTSSHGSGSGTGTRYSYSTSGSNNSNASYALYKWTSESAASGAHKKKWWRGV